MAEREILVDKQRLQYEGLFNFSDLYAMIDEWFEYKGYDKREKKNIESIKPDGKYIEIEFEPWKKITDYAKSVIKVRMIANDMKVVEIERDGVKIKVNQGKLQFVFDVYLETDYENRWEQKPMFVFLRTLFDKYIFRTYTTSYQNEVLADFKDLHSQIRSFLNLYRMR